MNYFIEIIHDIDILVFQSMYLIECLYISNFE